MGTSTNVLVGTNMIDMSPIELMLDYGLLSHLVYWECVLIFCKSLMVKKEMSRALIYAFIFKLQNNCVYSWLVL